MIIVKCPNCGSSNPGQAAFCTECGCSLVDAKMICPNCGGENDKRARFCMACGSKLDEDLLKETVKIAPEDQAASAKEDVQDQSMAMNGEAQKDSSGLSDDVIEADERKYDKGSFTAEAVNEERFRDFHTDAAEDSKEEHNKENHNKEEYNKEEGSREEQLREEQSKEEGSREEGSREGTGKGKTGKKEKTIFVILGLAAAALIVIFFALNSGPRMESLEVAYDGDTAAGTVLDQSNKGIKVVGLDQDGEKHEITDWTIEKPQTLEMDGSATVTIAYKDLSKSFASWIQIMMDLR